MEKELWRNEDDTATVTVVDLGDKITVREIDASTGEVENFRHFKLEEKERALSCAYRLAGM